MMLQTLRQLPHPATRIQTIKSKPSISYNSSAIRLSDFVSEDPKIYSRHPGHDQRLVAVTVKLTRIVARTSFMGAVVVTVAVDIAYDMNINAGGAWEGMRAAITILPQIGMEPPLWAMKLMTVPVAVEMEVLAV